MQTSTKNSVILKVAIPSPLRNTFDYLPPKNSKIKIKPGMRILVPFGKRQAVGLIIKITTDTSFELTKIKNAIDIIDKESLIPRSIMELINWTSDYYHHPIGDVVNNALPTLLRKKIDITNYHYDKTHSETTAQIKKLTTPIKLNDHQITAIATIKKNINNFKTFLLDGVTGSGKTEVYLRTITEVISSKKQALVLVPEINLTPQTIERFTNYFSVPIAIFHSRLTPKQRLLTWLKAKDGYASIIIGTRSAIFIPLKFPGIIIIDEEHDNSFKQQSGLRYSARDLAVIRGKLENIPVVLGSATPSIESIYNAKKNRYLNLSLPQRAGGATQPAFHIIDARNQKLKDGITDTLLQQIKKHLDNDGQVLIFLNRRGYAPILICNNCGWSAECKHCDAKLTMHQKEQHLRCHHCGVVEKIPTKCKQCGNEKLFLLGAGTQRIEDTIQKLLPQIKLIRIDRDTTKRKNSLEKILNDIHLKEYQILIGTQMLAKGHHFPNVTMAAILNADQSLFSSDFRATEHLAQLIVQVAGRAGREQKPGEVYLQTYNPHHPLILNLTNFGYQGFVTNCLSERQNSQLPPYSYLALIHAESKLQEASLDFLTKLRTHTQPHLISSVNLYGPVPAIMERKAGYFRAQLLIQSGNRQLLKQTIEKLLSYISEIKPQNNIRWFFDIDPIEINN